MNFVYAGVTMNRKSLEEVLLTQVKQPKEIIEECIQFLTKYPDGDFRVNNKKITLLQENKGEVVKNG